MWTMRDLCLHLLPPVLYQPSTLVQNPCQRDVAVEVQPRELSFCSVLVRWLPLDIQFLHVSSARVQLEVVVPPEAEKLHSMFQPHPFPSRIQEGMAKKDHGDLEDGLVL